jgi:hypothetical protein
MVFLTVAVLTSPAAHAKKKKKADATPDGGAAAASSAQDTQSTPAPAAAPAPAAKSAQEMEEEEAEEERSRTAGLGRVKIEHVNEMGTGFKLVKVFYELNNHSIFPDAQKPPPDFSQKTLAIWDGVLPIGDNDLKITAVFRGIGSGLLTYMNDMTFTKTDTVKVKVTEGQETSVTVISEEDSSPLTATEDRPRFDYRFATAPMQAAKR